MTTAIAERTPNGNALASPAHTGTFPILSREQLDLAKRTVAKGATDDEFAMFLNFCHRKSVSPLDKQIFFMKYGDQVSFVASYHFLLGQVQQSGLFEGMTTALFAGRDGVWKELWTEEAPPFACKVGVYRRGYKEPVYSIRYLSEVEQNGGMWKRMKIHLLRKCTIVDALRIAFDDILQGLYIQEEMPVNGEVVQPSQAEQKHGHAHPAYPVVSKTGWQYESVPDAFLPTPLRGAGHSYQQLATSKEIAWKSEKNGNTYTGRQLVHMWQSGKDQALSETAEILLAMYPSEKATQPEEEPPVAVTGGME